MRFVFLIPDLERRELVLRAHRTFHQGLERRFMAPFRRSLRRSLGHPGLRTAVVFGGTLNIMRHCWVARKIGADAVLATMSGKDTYGTGWGIKNLPFIAWSDRRPDDVCVLPDFATEYVDDVRGPAIAYLQVPTHIHADFDYRSPRVTLWTDSPFMLARCQEVYVDKEIAIVPNVVDDDDFPFIPQRDREPGLIFAFPRKGPDFIAETQARYRELGGKYWKFQLVDGVTLHELARMFRRPQAFLASAEVEGCALPPQESMAAGVVVVGKNARGANFSMEHRKTAMVAETPRDAAESLRELEDVTLRENIARDAHEFISRYFPAREPAVLWRDLLHKYAPKAGAARVATSA